MTLEEMKLKKQQKGYSYTQISELSQVPLGTVQKIFSGETENPRYATLQALERVLKDDDNSMTLNDSGAYDYELGYGKRQGDYTVEDYYAIPDEIRVELIDGCIYDMAAPHGIHQGIAGEFFAQIHNFIRNNKGSCIPFMSPIDVQLDCDDKTMVQPDVIILCDRDKFKKGKIFGAPDFVLEVISPSTSRRDYYKKLAKYEGAGVREYWIMDPYKKQIAVFFFEEDIYARIYDLSEPVPVSLYGGELLIQTDYIRQWCEELEKE
jgi:Uma2 family endonuclease